MKHLRNAFKNGENMDLKLLGEKEERLKQRTADMNLEDFDVRSLLELEKKMIEFSNQLNAAGLAASQIGLPERVFVVTMKNDDGTKFEKAYFNPKISKISKDTSLMDEGCLSVPFIFLKLKRSNSLTIDYFDAYKNPITAVCEGILAKIIQHEYDHLEGKLITSRASKLKLDMARKKSKKIYKKLVMDELRRMQK